MNKRTAAITASAVAVPLLLMGAAAGFSSIASAHAPANLTDEQKQVIEQVKELRESGEHEQAHALAQEAGLPQKGPHMKNRGEIKEAIANADYEAFQALTADAPVKFNVDEETFAKMVEAHTLREAGDHEGAREIMEEIGVKPPRFHKHGGNFQTQ